MSSGVPEAPSDGLEIATEEVEYCTGVAENGWADLESNPRWRDCDPRKVESDVDGTRQEEARHEAAADQGHWRYRIRCSSQPKCHCEEKEKRNVAVEFEVRRKIRTHSLERVCLGIHSEQGLLDRASGRWDFGS